MLYENGAFEIDSAADLTSNATVKSEKAEIHILRNE